MTDSSVIDIAVQSILLATKLAAPILGVSLAIGLFIGLIQSALRAGMVQGDGIHLTAEGCRRVAMGLIGSVR